ncbi:MAG TPA: single-stranded DNA-binding protein [Verrucomicrobiales bacterium]|nr:single-stranded DNA-binding protein [Verrucomicrobiales bacterium]
MASYNKVILIGNLTRDPELRYSAKGTAIAKIGVAVNRRWRNEAGEWQEETTFVDVDAFGRQAETIGQYLKKGRPIMIEGRLRLDQWEDKNSGQKRSRLGVVLETFQFMDSGRGGGDSDGGNAPSTSSSPSSSGRVSQAPPSQDDPDALPSEDDVPF